MSAYLSDPCSTAKASDIQHGAPIRVTKVLNATTVSTFAGGCRPLRVGPQVLLSALLDGGAPDAPRGQHTQRCVCARTTWHPTHACTAVCRSLWPSAAVKRAANLCFACIQGGIHTDTSRYSITPFDDGCGLRRCSARTSDAPHAVWALGSMAHAAERARAKCQHRNPCPLSAAQRSMDGAVSVGGWWGGERAARLRLLPAAMRVRGRLNKSVPQG
eukprot:1305276-Prymnesium_polylepis.1